MNLLPDVRVESVTSDDGQYRFRLERTWDEAKPKLVWIGCHPTTDPPDRDNHGLRKMEMLTRRWEWGGIVVVNLFALRCRDQYGLNQHPAPVGPNNDEHVIAACTNRTTRAVIAAWGNRGRLFGRSYTVKGILSAQGVDLWRMGGPLTRYGEPWNPMMMPLDTLPLPWLTAEGRRRSVRRIAGGPS